MRCEKINVSFAYARPTNLVGGFRVMTVQVTSGIRRAHVVVDNSMACQGSYGHHRKMFNKSTTNSKILSAVLDL